jgi:hypothetical protein
MQIFSLRQDGTSLPKCFVYLSLTPPLLRLRRQR